MASLDTISGISRRHERKEKLKSGYILHIEASEFFLELPMGGWFSYDSKILVQYIKEHSYNLLRWGKCGRRMFKINIELVLRQNGDIS